jgi:hypothetical protein
LEISEDTVVARGRDTAWQVVEDKVVVVTPRTRRIHILDGTGGRIWECIEEPRDVRSVVSAIGEEFDVERDRALGETVRFLKELVEKGMVEVRD